MALSVSEDEENEFECTTELYEAEDGVQVDLLPPKSREVYWCVYDAYIKWKEANGVKDIISEDIALRYFEELSTRYKPSSLWSKYSMLRSTVHIKHNIKIEDYKQLLAFLKQNSSGYSPKKAKGLVLTPHDVKRFLNTAPNNTYLVTKVALIFGLFGACRNYELVRLSPKDVIDHGQILKVIVRDAKTNTSRSFFIEGDLLELVKAYRDLRPKHSTIDRFFLAYKNGTCSNLPLGKNKLGIMCKDVAKFLQLPNHELYTGRTFRRSSASVCADPDIAMTDFKSAPWEEAPVIPESFKKHPIPQKRKKKETPNEYNNESTRMKTEMPDPIADSRRLATTMASRSTEPINQNILPNNSISHPLPTTNEMALECGEQFLNWFKAILPCDKFIDLRNTIDFCTEFSIRENQQAKEDGDESAGHGFGYSGALNEVFLVESHGDIKQEIVDEDNYE